MSENNLAVSKTPNIVIEKTDYKVAPSQKDKVAPPQTPSQKEFEQWEQQEYEKERKREYYREKDRKNEERFDRMEKQLLALSSYFEKMVELKEKELSMQKRQQNIDVDNSFEAQIRQMQNERHYREQQKEYDINYVGDLEYSLFCAWCNGYRPVILPGTETEYVHNGEIMKGGKLDIEKMKKTSYVNPQFFKEYCEQEYPNGFKRKISDDRIKRYIGEKFFGYEYYTDENGKLRARKKSQ